MKQKIAIVLTLVVTLIISATASAMTIPGLTNNKYIKTYGLSTQNNTPVYTNARLNVRGTISRAYNATIYATDEIYIYAMNDNWAYISYPTGNTRSKGYIRTSAVTGNNFSKSPLKSRKQITTYKRPGSASYGYISNNDDVWTVARSGNYTQVIYPAGSVYKTAWISNSDYDNYIAQSTPTPTPTKRIKGDMNGDGKVNETDVELLKQYYFDEGGAYVDYADIDNNGKIDLYDVTRLVEIVYDQPKIPEKLQNLIKEWKDKTWSNGYFSGYNKKTNPNAPRECKEFASFIFYKLWGIKYVGSGSVSSNPTNYILNDTPNTLGKRGTTTSLTATKTKELFQNAKPGDFIQMKRISGNPHSAIVGEINNEGVWFFEANAPDPDGRNYIYNKIKYQFHSWQNLAEKNSGMSVYYAK